jgi:hypothetical protein
MDKIKLIGIDIANPDLTGSTSEVEGGYDIIGGGADIWNEADQFHLAYKEHTGDFEFITRVEALEMGHPYAKAGIMVRESLDADSELIYIFAFPNNSPRNKNNGGFEFHCRDKKHGECFAVYPADFTVEPPLFPVNFPNAWLKMTRSGDKFDCYCSQDGEEWKLYNSYTLKLSPKLYIGLGVTSHDNSITVTAKFRDIVIK